MEYTFKGLTDGGRKDVGVETVLVFTGTGTHQEEEWRWEWEWRS